MRCGVYGFRSYIALYLLCVYLLRLRVWPNVRSCSLIAFEWDCSGFLYMALVVVCTRVANIKFMGLLVRFVYTVEGLVLFQVFAASDS